MGEANHSRGGGPSGTAVGAAEEAGAARGAAVGAARGRNLGWTTGAGRGATSGSNPGGTSEAGWQGATVPAVVNRAEVHHPVLDRGRGRVERHGAEGVGQRLLVPACAKSGVPS
jgi:hypothetical protein